SVGTSSSYCMDDFMKALGTGAVGLFASDKPGADEINASALLPEGSKNLAWARNEFSHRFHRSMEEAALAGFANTWALVDHVLPAASGTDPKDVAAAALATKLPQGTLANGSGIDLAGPGEVDAGANRAAVSVIWEWLSPTEQAIVWPPAFANHSVEMLPIQH
ncbi:MAG: branched-chain amino acid transport system substrate-binding protein, partial [Acidimicrobiaceae bacterium]|nr:branched-chain amino acid transport system substrate-binding protein [Acidimicrobiaceae bacterium]